MVVYHGDIETINENITPKLKNQNKHNNKTNNKTNKTNTSSQINIHFDFDKVSRILKITYLAGYTIYHSIQKSIINILILTSVNRSTNDPEQSELLIHIPIPTGSYSYNIEITTQYECSVSKKVKKCLIDKVDGNLSYQNTPNTSNTFYIYDNQYIMMIDTLGKFYYFPDSIDLEDKTINAINAINTTTLGIELPINLNPDSYSLYDLTQNSTLTTNTNATITTNTTTNTIVGLLSWLNPLSYIYTYSNTNTNLGNDTDSQLDMNNSNSNSNSNESVMIQKTKYYFVDGDKILIHLDSNANAKVKILKLHEIQIPCHIVNIYKNSDSGNVILDGVMDESRQNVSITFNKYLLNPIINYGF